MSILPTFVYVHPVWTCLVFTGSQMVMNQNVQAVELNLSPLQDLKLFLTTEPSFQPHLLSLMSLNSGTVFTVYFTHFVYSLLDFVSWGSVQVPFPSLFRWPHRWSASFSLDLQLSQSCWSIYNLHLRVKGARRSIPQSSISFHTVVC